MKSAAIILGLALSFITLAAAADPPAKDGEKFVPLFNGKDLAGWVPVNVAPTTFTREGRHDRHHRQADRHHADGAAVRELHPGARMAAHGSRAATPASSSGATRITAVGHALQPRASRCRCSTAATREDYTSHGDVFSIWGATMKPDRPHPNGSERCLPSEQRAKPSPEWNHYRVTCQRRRRSSWPSTARKSPAAASAARARGTSAWSPRAPSATSATSGSRSCPRRIPTPAEVADEAQGFVPLYTGLDLAGWKDEPGHKRPLAAEGLGPASTTARARPKSEGQEPLDREGVRRLPDGRRLAAAGEADEEERPVVLPSGDDALDDDGKVEGSRGR